MATILITKKGRTLLKEIAMRKTKEERWLDETEALEKGIAELEQERKMLNKEYGKSEVSSNLAEIDRLKKLLCEMELKYAGATAAADQLQDQREALKAEIRELKAMQSIGSTSPRPSIDNMVMHFIRNVRPQLLMGELQAIAALAVYLKSGDEKDIPGSAQRRTE